MSSKKILKNFFSFSIGNWLNIIIGIITIPLITRILSPEEFGRVSMFILAVNILMIFSIFGIDQSFVRFYYEEDSKNRPKLLQQSIKLPLVIFIFLAFGVLIFKRELSILLFNIEDPESIYLLIGAVFFSIINSFGLLILRMEQKGIKYSVLQFLTKFLDLLFMLLFYYLMGADYKIMIFSYTISIAIVTLITIYFGKYFWLNVFSSEKNRLKNSLSETINFAYPLLLTTVFVWLLQSIDRFSIKHWNSMEELGLYSAIYKIISVLFILRSSFTVYWAPLAYEQYQLNPNNKTFFEKMYSIVFVGMFLITLGFIMTKDLFVFLLGESYQSSINLLPFLALIPIMSVISEVTQVGISFVKKTKWNMVITFVVCVFNISANFILVPNMGAKGASISAGLSYLLYFILRTHISQKYFKVGYQLKQSYFFIGLLITYIVYSTFWSWNIFNLIFGCILCIVFILFNYTFIKSNLSKMLVNYAK